MAFRAKAPVSRNASQATYGASETSGPHFLVAEDPGGINTGSEWCGEGGFAKRGLVVVDRNRRYRKNVFFFFFFLFFKNNFYIFFAV